MRGAVCGKLLGLDEVKGIDQRRVAPTLKPRDRRLVTKNWNSSQEPRNLTRTAHVGMFELIMRRPAPIEIHTKQVNTHTGKGKGQTGRPLAQAPRLRGPAPVPQVAKPREGETVSPEVVSACANERRSLRRREDRL